jgi:hypothetical protein
MFENEQLTRCRRRKEELLQQSAAHRSALVAEAQSLRPIAAWVDLGVAATRKLRAGWEALAPLLSLWQAGKQEPGGLIQKITNGIALARSLMAIGKKWF